MNERTTHPHVEPLERRSLLSEVVAMPRGGGKPAEDHYEAPSATSPVQYQAHSISFDGPLSAELDSTPNPFLDYRLNVSFVHESGARVDNVPGYFNGDGAGGAAGTKWKVLFTPPLPGKWKYAASFRAGPQVAVSLEAAVGAAAGFDGAAGAFTVAPVDGNAPGFLGKGMLRHAGFYQRFENGEYYVKAGMNSPENFLGYSGFDNTPDALHDYAAHVADWQPGDPDWNNGAGKGIIGLLNYVAGHGVNSIFFMPMNIGGDAEDTWPFAGNIDPRGRPTNDNLHYDISKLAQWETVFAHAQRKGVKLHMVLNEAEDLNKLELDNATLGVERKLFYRELAARFAHHNALQWNVSEEYDHYRLVLSPQTVAEWAGYIQAVDPYDHPIAIHNFEDPDQAFTPFLGDTRFSASSFQYASSVAGRGDEVEEWRSKAQSAGRPVHISMDELRATSTGNQAAQRRDILWPTLFSGGSAEFYFGGEPELTINDFRPYDDLWRWSGIALDVMATIPFWQMQPMDELLTGESASSTTGSGQVFARPGDVYAIYLPRALATGTLDLSGDVGKFDVTWVNPRSGDLYAGTRVTVHDAAVPLGAPPADADEDWVVLLRKVSGTLAPPAAPTGFQLDDLSDDSATLAWRDNADNESGFRIERSTDGVHFTDVALAPANATSIVIDGLAPATTYYFRIRAYNTAGVGASPLVVQMTTDEKVWPFQISRLVLVNADTDQDIATLSQGYVINFAAIGTNRLNIRAEVTGPQVGSVRSIRFALDATANFGTDNGAPYALAGGSGTNYNPWTPALGRHTVTATPFSSSNAGGTAGAALTLSFWVSNNAAAAPDTVAAPRRRDIAIPPPTIAAGASTRARSADLLLSDDENADRRRAARQRRGRR